MLSACTYFVTSHTSPPKYFTVDETFAWFSIMRNPILALSAGELAVPDGVEISLLSPLNAEPPIFTLTCTSIGGPAATVTWTRDSVSDPLTNSNVFSLSQMVLDTVTANYSNQITVTGRLPDTYRCDIENDEGSDRESLIVQSKICANSFLG